ncbi:MAG: DUF4178 domain-containing protein [Bacteroidota bacterium]
MALSKLFSRFRKKPEIRTDLKITGLRKGDLLDYFLKTWQITQVDEYDWGNNILSREYTLNSGDETVYLHLEEHDGLELSLSRKIKLSDIDRNLKEHIVDHDDPPRKLTYEGKVYQLSDESLGHSREEGDQDGIWSELVSYTFMDDQEQEFLSIERWGEYEISAAHGQLVKPFEFSNLLPGQS